MLKDVWQLQGIFDLFGLLTVYYVYFKMFYGSRVFYYNYSVTIDMCNCVAYTSNNKIPRNCQTSWNICTYYTVNNPKRSKYPGTVKHLKIYILLYQIHIFLSSSITNTHHPGRPIHELLPPPPPHLGRPINELLPLPLKSLVWYSFSNLDFRLWELMLLKCQIYITTYPNRYRLPTECVVHE